MINPAISAKRVVKRFVKFTAVDNLDLNIEPCIVYGLLGPNGSGKTTTIRMLCGLTKPTSGESFALGISSHSKRIASVIGYMPQEVALYNDLTVGQNLDLYGELQGMSKASIRSRKDELLALVELKDWKGAVLTKLSGGMKRRASLICAMIHPVSCSYSTSRRSVSIPNFATLSGNISTS
jgi:ABC-2 type transport system ATP-binding protein